MKAVSESYPPEKSNTLKAIIFGGLLAGTLDLTAACVTNYWISPVRIFQTIASGLLGAKSYEGGAWTAILGVFLHFVIAFGATIVFYLASRKIKFLIAQPVISGVIYGIAVYVLMYYIIVPLSVAPFQMPHDFASTARDVFIHIVCVGLPIALVVRYYTKSEK